MTMTHRLPARAAATGRPAAAVPCATGVRAATCAQRHNAAAQPSVYLALRVGEANYILRMFKSPLKKMKNLCAMAMAFGGGFTSWTMAPRRRPAHTNQPLTETRRRIRPSILAR